MSTRLALCLMKELAFKALLLPGVKKAPSLRMMDLLLFSLVSFKLKMRIYKTAVCSLLTYGCEAWDLNEKTIALINGAWREHSLLVKIHR